MRWGGRMKGQEQTEKDNSAPICSIGGWQLAVHVFICRLQIICLHYMRIYAVKWSQMHCTQHNCVGLLKSGKLPLITTILCTKPSMAATECSSWSNSYFFFSFFLNFGIRGQWTTYTGCIMFQNSYIICRWRWAEFFCLFIAVINHMLSKVFIYWVSCKLMSAAKYFAVLQLIRQRCGCGSSDPR